jgi:hypothetical protein
MWGDWLEMSRGCTNSFESNALASMVYSDECIGRDMRRYMCGNPVQYVTKGYSL